MHGIVFLLLAAGMATAGVMFGGWHLLLLWPVVGFGLAGAAYVGVGPRVFGKQPSGRMLWWTTVLMLPFLLFTWAVWHVARLLSREPACHEVCPGLWLGRRLLPGELPEQVKTIVDLTCEFPEPRAIVRDAEYVCLPTLDATAPGRDGLLRLLTRIRDLPGGIYVHCASGHGRSALVAAALLLVRGRASDAKEALELVRKARSGVRLQPSQFRLLESIQDASAI